MVREWDVSAAPSVEIENVVSALNVLLAVDLPDDPPWRVDSFREYLAVTMPGERRITWLAEPESSTAGGHLRDGDGVLGYGSVLLFADMAVLEVLVHPKARGGGVGRALLVEAVRRAYAEGYRTMGVEAIGDTASAAFYERYGFDRAYTETRSILDLSGVDWPHLGEMADGVSAGYRIEYHPGGPPEEMHESYAAAKYLVRAQEDPGDLDLRPSSRNAQRLAASLATLHLRGLKPYIVVALHEVTGAVAGLTEVVVAAQHPNRADQYDTIVVPQHRGYGLIRAMKSRMLFELRSAEPQISSVQTWNSLDTDGVRTANAELGFRPDRQWHEYQADVPELAARLGIA